MKTVKLICREINGENGIFCKTGDSVVAFIAEVIDNTGLITEHIIVSNAASYHDAKQYAQFYYCGYLYRIRKILTL